MKNMFRGDLKPICYILTREALGRIANLRLSERQHKHSKAVLSVPNETRTVQSFKLNKGIVLRLSEYVR